MTKCNPHPDAPHSFMRDASHSADRYVCECESWTPPTKEELQRRKKLLDELQEITEGEYYD